MFTVLSKTRNSNLFLIGALMIGSVTLLALAVVPSISAPQLASAPAARLSEAGSDYYLRHPELGISAALAAHMAGDFYLRHPEWIAPADAPLDECFDVSIGELAACHSGVQAPGLACESPVDCR